MSSEGFGNSGFFGAPNVGICMLLIQSEEVVFGLQGQGGVLRYASEVRSDSVKLHKPKATANPDVNGY